LALSSTWKKEYIPTILPLSAFMTLRKKHAALQVQIEIDWQQKVKDVGDDAFGVVQRAPDNEQRVWLVGDQYRKRLVNYDRHCSMHISEILIVVTKNEQIQWNRQRSKIPKCLKLTENASNVRSDSERRSDTTTTTTRNILNS